MDRARRRGTAATELRALVPEVVGHHTPFPVRIEPDVEGILEQGTMSFGSAMEAVCQGAEVRRAGWGTDPTVVYLHDGIVSLRGPAGQHRPVLVTEGDIQNADWEVVPSRRGTA